MSPKSVKGKKESLEPLEEIKRLLILQLITGGVSTEDIGKTLSVSPRTIQRLVSTRKTKKRRKKHRKKRKKLR